MKRRYQNIQPEFPLIQPDLLLMAVKMKPVILPLALLIIVSGCYAVSSVKTGNGRAADDFRELEPFSRIVVTGTFDVEVVRDSIYFATITLDENLLSNISTSVHEGSLYIRVNERMSNYVQARLLIGSPYISQIKTMGTHRLKALEIDSDVLELTSTGTLHTELAGLVDQFDLILDGSTVVNAGGLEALYVDLKAEGVTTATVNAVRTIRANGSGSTRIWYGGTPGSVESNIEGRGFVMKIEERE